jgi:hypothetical protein
MVVFPLVAVLLAAILIGDARISSAGLATATAGGLFTLRSARAKAPTTSTHLVAFAVFQSTDPWSAVATVGRTATTLGRPIEYLMWYQGWGSGFPALDLRLLRGIAASGRIPVLTWEPWVPGKGVQQPAYSLRRIAAGDFDAYIAAAAQVARAYGRTLYLRPLAEMNGGWNSWSPGVNGNRPADFIAAWRHIHDVFARAGASNVKWVFSPNTSCRGSTPLRLLYPGRSYVDVLALDGYNWGSGRSTANGAGPRWRSFDAIFHASYLELAQLGPQPIWIGETASATVGGDKAAWVRAMWRSVESPRYARVSALTWFNTDKERDWRATADSRVAAAFRP